MEAIGQLTGGVAHDFNNLLTPTAGSLDRLQRKDVGDEHGRRLIDGALQSAERAAAPVRQLLAFAPPAAPGRDRGEPDPRHGRVRREHLGGPRVRVELDIAPDLPPALADADQLGMALLNL
jgi:signal transduction histidine kinase